MIPVLMVEGNGIAEAWEKSLIAVYDHGCRIKTQYDKPNDPPSLDSTMIITIHAPLSEPMIHRDFPGGFEDLQEYVMEVVDGIKNHLVRDSGDPDDTRWEYTYNERLFKYSVPGLDEPIDQIEDLAQKLAESPFSRRAQAITWKVWEDNACYDPACLQSLWCRLTEEDNGILHLNSNVRFRSNDAYKAAFMNIFALTRLQQKIAARITEICGKEVRLGRYMHMADSYHIYGAYFNEFENRFMNAQKTRPFEQRTMNYDDVKDMMLEAIPRIRQKVQDMTRT